MKILLLADVENRGLWDFYDKSKTEDIDLIISCGDLHPDYLQFLVTMTSIPLLYVRGNHDAKYDDNPPLGCTPIDDTIYNFRGLRILGLGGSMRYHDGNDMYTESEMRHRIGRLRKKLLMTGGFDMLVTHAPAAGYGDMDDLPHQGFVCFNTLIEKWQPKYMIHGHVHKEYGHFVRSRTHKTGCSMINAYDSYVLEVSEDEYPPYGKTGSPLYDMYISLTGKGRT